MTTWISKIVGSGNCLGCGLCSSMAGHDAVAMEMGPGGFPAPRELRAGGDQAWLGDLCPGITVRRANHLRGGEKTYGPFRALKTAHATDPDIRRKASSGGCITALLVYLLEQSLADGVLHAGKADGEPLRTTARISRTREEVVGCAGSRYAPCSLLENLDEDLREGGRLAIVGKPCDIAAVRAYLSARPNRSTNVACLLSFACMGMPSINATHRLVQAMGAREADIRDFWYRGNGWPGSATVVGADGCRKEMSYEQSWGRILSKEVKMRCRLCPDGFGEFADISCGDAWHSEGGRPVFDERPGRSLVFIRSAKGQELFESAQRHGYLESEAFSEEELPIIQPSQHQRKLYAGVRLLAAKAAGDRLLDFSGFPICADMSKARLTTAAKNFVGTFRRMRKARRVP